MQRTLGLFLLLMGVAANSLAGVTRAPEIDPTSIGAAAALFAGGMLVIQYRRRK